MPFKFRLEKVLVLRHEAVEKAQLEVIAATKAIEEARLKLEANIQEIKERNEDLIKNNYQRAQDHLRVIKHLTDLQKKLRENLRAAEFRLVKAKKALVNAQMELEAMEKLKEKRKEEYLLEENLSEQKETDERATLKFTNEMMKRGSEETEY